MLLLFFLLCNEVRHDNKIQLQTMSSSVIIMLMAATTTTMTKMMIMMMMNCSISKRKNLRGVHWRREVYGDAATVGGTKRDVSLHVLEVVDLVLCAHAAVRLHGHAYTLAERELPEIKR